MNVRAVRNLLRCVTFSNTHDASLLRSKQIPWLLQTTNRALYSVCSTHNEHRFRYAHPLLVLHTNGRHLDGGSSRTIMTTFIHNGQSKPQRRPNVTDAAPAAADKQRHNETEHKQPETDVDSTPAKDAEEKKTDDVQVEKTNETNAPDTEQQLTLTQRFKKMYKEYWYVLLPVHLTTSCLWMGGLYYLSSR